MLPVVYGFAIAALATGKQVGVAAARNRSWFGAEHPSQAERASSHRALCRAHHPIDAPKLLRAARAGLAEKLDKRGSVDHHHPWPARLVNDIHRRVVWKP